MSFVGDHFWLRYLREDRFGFAIQLRASLPNSEDDSPQNEVTTFPVFREIIAHFVAGAVEGRQSGIR
jgi:hypothetical protein